VYKDKKYPKVSIILVNYLNYKDTIGCIRSLHNITYPNYEIIVVDNSEDEESYEIIKNCSGINLIKSEKNLGFAGGNNLGIKIALAKDADYVLLLNNDTIVKENFLNELVIQSKDSSAGIATGKIYYLDQPTKIWGAGGRVDWKRGMGIFYGINEIDTHSKYNKQKYISFASGCMMFIKKEVLENIGLLNESFYMYCEDVEYCIRANRNGVMILYVPSSIVWHKIGLKKARGSYFHFYYIVRNTIFIIKKYTTVTQMIKYISFSIPYFIINALFELLKKNPDIMKAMLRGFYDGIIGNAGKVT